MLRVGQATVGYITMRMRLACWTTKSTDINTEYVIFIATMVTRKLLNVTSHLEISSLYFYRQENMKCLNSYSAVECAVLVLHLVCGRPVFQISPRRQAIRRF